MKIRFLLASSAASSVLGFSLLAMSFTGCATFVGPGEFQAGVPSRATASTEAPTQTAQSQSVKSIMSTGELVPANGQPVFDWPVDEARLTRGFFSASVRPKRKKAHLGVDLANHKGTPIMSAQKGEVVYVGSGFRGYGRMIIVEHNNEWATLYSHLDKYLVDEGDQVKQGQKIGLMGRTGHATGNHLHFEIRHNKKPVNPLAYLPDGEERAKSAKWTELVFHAKPIQLSQQAPQEPTPAKE